MKRQKVAANKQKRLKKNKLEILELESNKPKFKISLENIPRNNTVCMSVYNIHKQQDN